MTTQNRRDRAGGRDRLTPQGQQTGPQLATSPDPGADPAAPAPPLQWPRSSARENAEDDANDPRTVRPTELGLTTCNPSSAKSQTAGTAQRSSHPATTPNRKTLPASTQRHTPATASGSLLERKTSAYKKCHLCVRTTVTHVSGLYTASLPRFPFCRIAQAGSLPYVTERGYRLPKTATGSQAVSPDSLPTAARSKCGARRASPTVRCAHRFVAVAKALRRTDPI